MRTNDLPAARQLLSELWAGTANRRVLCAVSGGVDSMSLLHLLATWGREQGAVVAAAHFNHHLRGEFACRDEAFVREQCRRWDIPLLCGEGDVRACAAREGMSLEEAARCLRYAFLQREKARGEYDVILTAHHADDNAETMLLHLLRGTGLRGLAGIPPLRDGIARPFLRITRAEVEAYAHGHEIPYVEDETNALDDAARNVLRHQVLPVLRELNGAAVENMSRAAELLRRDEEALEADAHALTQTARRWEGGIAISQSAFSGQLPAVVSRAVYQLTAELCGRRDLSAAHVEAVCALLRGGAGREVSLPRGVTARREGDTLVFCSVPQPPEERPIAVGETVLFGSWRVRLERGGSEGTPLSLPPEKQLTVTRWRREDRMLLPGSRGARSLKRLCADAGIPPWKREILPVLRVGQQAAAVPGLGIHSEFLPDSHEEPVRVIFYQETEENRREK